MVEGKLRDTLIEAGFKAEDVREEAVGSMAWWGSEEEFASSASETLKLMVGSGWSEGEKEGMKKGFREVIGEVVGQGVGGREEWGVVYEMGEDGVVKRVGTKMEAWAGIAVKR